MASRVTTEWMEGDSGKPMPDFLNGRDAVVWARTYSAEDPERCDCDTLQTALGMVPGADRMVRKIWRVLNLKRQATLGDRILFAANSDPAFRTQTLKLLWTLSCTLP